MMTILKQSGRTVLALMLIMPLTSLYSYYKKEGGGQVYYFTQKKTDLNTGLFSYPKDFLITKETAEKTRLYYKVEFNPLFLPKYEGLYVNNKLVSEYKYHYNNTQLTRRDYYDNLMLIEKLSYFYNKRGVLIKVERRDSENNPTGDWYSYNNGMLTELTRYRNKKKSFIKKFKNGGLVETREILTKEIHVTRYNHSGQVVSEQKIKKPGFGDVAVLYEYQPLLLADISEIKKFSVTRPDWRCEFKLSGSSKTHWMIKEGISSYMAENPKITLLLREIKNLHSMKVFKGKGLKLSSYSLDKAKLRIELVDKDGMLHKILVGDEVEGENAYYVTNQLWGDVIYQVSRKKLDDILYLNKYNYIKKRLFHLTVKEVAGLEFGGVSLVRKNNGWHNLTKPSVSRQENGQLLRYVLSTGVLRFIVPEIERKQLEGRVPDMTIKVQTKERIIRVRLYKLGAKVFAHLVDSEEYYEVTRGYLKALLAFRKKYIKG